VAVLKTQLGRKLSIEDWLLEERGKLKLFELESQAEVDEGGFS
jgi:hypothetical protein